MAVFRRLRAMITMGASFSNLIISLLGYCPETVVVVTVDDAPGGAGPGL